MRPATPLHPCAASSARKFAVKPGPSAESNAGPRKPRRSARSRTNNTVGADMLPWPRSTSRSSRKVPFCRSSATSTASSTLAPPGWQISCGACSCGRLYEAAHRRGQLLFDEARQRAREHHPEADRIDRPAHDVERARPGMFRRRADASVRPRRSRRAAPPRPRHRRTAPTKSRRPWCRDRVRKVSVHSSTTTTRTTSPGSARASRRRSPGPTHRRHSRGRTLARA